MPARFAKIAAKPEKRTTESTEQTERNNIQTARKKIIYNLRRSNSLHDSAEPEPCLSSIRELTPTSKSRVILHARSSSTCRPAIPSDTQTRSSVEAGCYSRAPRRGALGSPSCLRAATRRIDPTASFRACPVRSSPLKSSHTPRQTGRPGGNTITAR